MEVLEDVLEWCDDESYDSSNEDLFIVSSINLVRV